MKSLPLRWALPAAALFLFFLTITLPAQHALGWFGGGRLAVAGIEGTAWQGSVQRLAVGGFALGPVVWELRPFALLTGRIEYQLFVQSGNGGGELRVGRGLFGAPGARDVRLTLPAADIGRQLRLPLVTLGGDFQIDAAEVAFADAWVETLQAQVLWQAAQTVQPSPVSLGTLQMQLSLRDGRIVGALGDQGGPLELGGEFSMGTDRRYQLNAVLKPRAAADPQLREALGLLGNPDAQGRYRLQYSGTL